MSAIDKINSAQKYSGQNSSAQEVDAAGFAEVYKAQTRDMLLQDLEKKYGVSIGVKSVGKDNKSIEKYALGSGWKEITLAPSVVDRMLADPKYLKKIEATIVKNVETREELPAQLKGMNRDYWASGTIVHDDGTVSTWVLSDDTPEEKARIKKAMDEQAEAKAERRERYVEIVKAAGEKRAAPEISSLRLNLFPTMGLNWMEPKSGSE
jgi:hypothetical protein